MFWNLFNRSHAAKEHQEQKQLKREQFEKALIRVSDAKKLIAYINQNGLSENAECYLIKFCDNSMLKELLEHDYVCNFKSAEKIFAEKVDDNLLRDYLALLQSGKMNLCEEATNLLLTKHSALVAEFVDQFKLYGSSQLLFITQFPQLVEQYAKHHGFKGCEAQIAYVKQASTPQIVRYVHKYGLTDKAEEELIKRANQEEISAYIDARQFHLNAEALFIKGNHVKILGEYLRKYRLHDVNEIVLLKYAGSEFFKTYLQYRPLSATGDAYIRKGLEGFSVSKDIFNAYATNYFWMLKEFYNSHQN